MGSSRCVIMMDNLLYDIEHTLYGSTIIASGVGKHTFLLSINKMVKLPKARISCPMSPASTSSQK